MKKKTWLPLLFVPLGLLIAFGPRTIFPVCPTGEMVMACQHTARAVFWAGLAIAGLGVVTALAGGSLVRLALTAATAAGGLLAILFPTVITGVCKSAEMTCRSLTLPALVILGGATILVAVAQAVGALRAGGNRGETRP